MVILELLAAMAESSEQCHPRRRKREHRWRASKDGTVHNEQRRIGALGGSVLSSTERVELGDYAMKR